MSNLGLFKFAEKHGIATKATKVGDRYVLETMLAEDFCIGGEQSGHIIFRDFMPTGDGQLSGIQMLSLLKLFHKPLSEAAGLMKTYPQTLLNIRATPEMKASLSQDARVQGEIDLRAVRDESGVVDAAHLDAAADGGGDRHRMGDRVGGEEGGNGGVLRDREGAGVGGHLRAVHQEVGEFIVFIRRGGEGDAAVGRGRAVRAEPGRGDRSTSSNPRRAAKASTGSTPRSRRST